MRTRDFLVVAGHIWHCERCRQALLDSPERVLRGFKLSEQERAALLSLQPEDFESAQALISRLDITSAEFEEGVSHPRSRMRHLV
ncbi:MAG TPA: hypothetical protein EYP04_06420 [Anaerolineae bacterium]|nr:hypothetical protein [Anaerolineae bacterium]HIQ06345.1 hypothetical protein [Anaerolineae bacterium]